MAKADLHLHSRFSNRPSEWFLQRLGAAQSYTEPERIYDRAKSKEMSFVTITDHNTIEGSLTLARKYPDAFSGVQSTTYFPEDGCKVHVLVWGLNEGQFEQVQGIRHDIYDLRDYLVEQKLAHSVAHATYSINNKLNVDHLEKLILLFDVFESMNGSQTSTSNSTLYYYLKYLSEETLSGLEDKHGIRPQGRDSWVKGFTGGSDDHAGLFIAKAYTMANANGADSFLESIRKKKSFAKGRSNDFHTFALTVYKVAHDFSRSKSKPLAVSPLISLPSVIFGEQKPSLLDRLAVVGLKAETGWKRQLGELVEEIRKRDIADVEANFDMVYDRIAAIVDEMTRNAIQTTAGTLKQGDLFALVKEVSAAIPALFMLVPFFTSMKHLHNNRALLGELQRALPVQQNRRILWFTDTLVDMNGPSVTLKNMGWEFYKNGIDVKIVTSLREDEITEELPPNTINLPRVHDFELPYYSQYSIKIPSVLKAMKLLNDFEPDEIFISTPGPVGGLGLLLAKLLSVRAVGIYHSDFTNELHEITDADDSAVDIVEGGLRWFYSQMDEIKVPTREYINILAKRGMDPERMSVFPRLIDHENFRYIPPEELNGNTIGQRPGINLLYVGRVSRDKNLEFLVKAFNEIRQRRDDVNLIVAGEGPYMEELKRQVGDVEGVSILGRVAHENLPAIYSQGHALVFPSTTDTFGMVVLEAQCCELPAVVSDVGGPREIVQDGSTGFVVPALNLDAWVGRLLDMIRIIETDPDKYQRMRETSRKRAISTYGWESVLKSLTTQVLVPIPRVLADD
ncbi:glycosyltransferase [bacterium]|nr:glycosyltransferase [bacterium]